MLIRNHKVVLVVHGEVLPVMGAFGVNLLCGFKIVCDIVVVAEHGLDLVSGAVKAIRNHKVLLVVHGEVLPVMGAFGVNVLRGFKIVCVAL